MSLYWILYSPYDVRHVNGGIKEESSGRGHRILISDLPSYTHVEGRGGGAQADHMTCLIRKKSVTISKIVITHTFAKPPRSTVKERS